MAALDWIGVDCLLTQGNPLANGYYSRHPVKCTVDRNEKNHNEIKAMQVSI